MIKEVEEILKERFGHDSLISLATSVNNVPSVRTVNTMYDSGSFYVITYLLSNKMKQISENSIVGISGEWFTGHGIANNLGYFGLEKNKEIAEKLRHAFYEWIDNGHNNFSDENTIILEIKLIDGVLFSHGRRFDL